MTAHVEEYVVRLRLTVQAGSRRPERRVPFVCLAVAEELDDVFGGSGLHDNLGDEPIRAGVRGKANEVDRSVEDLLLSEEGDEIGL